MKQLSQLLMLATTILVLNSCSNDFLEENASKPVFPLGESGLFISPEWEAADYWFSCPIARNIEFIIEEAPDWLQIETKTGNLTYTPSNDVVMHQKSIGSIRAKANVNPEYAKVGIYINYMKVKADGISYRIPVYYITEGKPVIEVQPTFTINYYSYNGSNLNIKNSGEGILMWDIVSMPDWLSVDTLNLNPNGIILAKNSQYNIPLKFNLNASLSANELVGEIILYTNDKENEFASIQVTANLGIPECNLSISYNNKIDFGTTATNYTVYLYNLGQGLLSWQFSNFPDWLSVDVVNGLSNPYSSQTLLFVCDVDKLDPGLNSATIQLKTNDPNNREIDFLVTVRGAGNNASTHPIEGIIVDALFVKNRNTMVYATSQPNKLVFYDVNSKTVAQEISLSKAPTYFTLSEDYTIAAVGHDKLISVIELGNYTVAKTIELSNTVYDIAWADSSLFCYTELVNNSNNIFWIDVNTEVITNLETTYIDGKTKIKKVPSKPFLIATKQLHFPSGVITYRIATRDLISYAHKGIGDFWFSENGEYFITKYGDVCLTSSATEFNVPTFATINPIDYLADSSDTRYNPWWVDHSSVTNKLFIINNHNNKEYVIFQFDDNDYLLENSYVYDRYYQPNTTTAAFEVQAHYVFANREGTELSVLKKGKDNTYWSLEFIQL